MSAKTAMLLYLALATPALAEEPTVAIWGWGGESCGRWLEIRQGRATMPRANEAMTQWVLGYLTAYNTFVSRTGHVFARTDAAAINVLVDRECSSEPQQLIAPAVATVIRLQEHREDGGSDE